MNTIGELLKIKDKKMLRIVTILISVSLLSGIIAIFVRQPMSWYDEGTHLTRVINLVNLDFMVVVNNDMSQIGGYISDSQNLFIEKATWLENNIDLAWLSHYTDIPYSDKLILRATTNTIINNPIVYLPYIVTGFVTKLLHFKPVIEYQLMRIVGLLFFFSCYVYAIRRTPIGKVTFAMLGVAPPVILGFSVISADSYLIVTAAIYLAVLFDIYIKCINGTEIKNKDIVELIVISVLLVLGKIPVFLFIALLLPLIFYGYKNKSLSDKNILKILITVGVCAIITLVWVYSLRNVNTGAFWGRPVDTGQQIQYILADKKRFLNLLLSSIFNYSFFALQTGYANTEKYMALPFVPCMFYFISFLLSAGFYEYDNDGLIADRSKRYVLYNTTVFLVVITFILFVFLALYLQFSVVGSNIIDGVQPRYFIPLWILICVNFTYGLKVSSNNWSFITLLSLFPLIAYHLYVIVQL